VNNINVSCGATIETDRKPLSVSCLCPLPQPGLDVWQPPTSVYGVSTTWHCPLIVFMLTSVRQLIIPKPNNVYVSMKKLISSAKATGA